MSEYVEYLKEVFSEFGSVEPRRMFGGYGIFHKGLMFALVADNALYLKADKPSPCTLPNGSWSNLATRKRGRLLRCPTTWLRRTFSTTRKKRRFGPIAPMPPLFAQTKSRRGQLQSPRKRSNDIYMPGFGPAAEPLWFRPKWPKPLTPHPAALHETNA